ncbi:MAG: hypothetical protein LJE69_00865 [Thiohalocapsa sp.]|jgi:hypothetical protein|uniref:hypothetical protein n=1 Tax=Thiohalocapsa sp. TaxID=2497641 RepID=UPI0025EF458F|nr:hypothetical protein [Thiohalocapsa sp.]MCG6939789.1 hypothetical protein [Thiohalocapsa sp.]
MPQPKASRPGRRGHLSAVLHRLALLLTLVIGASALVYNAVSIVNGDAGLMGLTKLFDAAKTDSALSSRRG